MRLGRVTLASKRPALVAALALLTTLLTEGVAFAADEREQCATSAEHAQQLRDEGQYRRAREQMLICAREVCPGPIKSDCGKWLSDLTNDAPTVVFGARDGRGNDVFDVKVSMDGQVIQERLDGKPVLVDSGEHTFKFENSDGAVRETRVLIRTAEKARPLVATFLTSAAGRDPVDDKGGTKEGGGGGSLAPGLIVGGVGVAALGMFAGFGLSGKGEVDNLQKCKPNCPEDKVDSARTQLIVADISLAVGVVALGVATYLLVTRSSGAAKVHARAPSPRKPARERWLRIDGGPVAGGGGYAGLGGSF
ncbi:MAG TPA: hypothetical protein VM580_28805 [Labilithrix sp.]|nr:hypothetical protein [Labilithrix sp.]